MRPDSGVRLRCRPGGRNRRRPGASCGVEPMGPGQIPQPRTPLHGTMADSLLAQGARIAGGVICARVVADRADCHLGTGDRPTEGLCRQEAVGAPVQEDGRLRRLSSHGPSRDRDRAVTHDRPRRRLVVVGLLACLVLGLVGVNAWAFAGHRTPRVVALPTAVRPPADPTAHTSDPTTTVAPVSTTVVIATTVPSTTTNAPRYVAPSTVPTTPPAKKPPTTTTVATTVSLHMTPSTASFPTTPPPYWPMPIVPVTITNTGGRAVSSIVVHPVGVYSIPSNTCTTTLMPGQSCSAQVQFCPTSPGHYLDALLVSGHDAVTGSPMQVSITLDGTAT